MTSTAREAEAGLQIGEALTTNAPAEPAPASFARQGAMTFGFSALTLSMNLVTGVVIARALGAEGRGEMTAILTLTQMVGWAFAFGCSEATAYREARHGRDSGVLSAWLVLMVPAGILAVGVGEALLPAALHAQSASTVRLAQLFMLSACFVPAGLLTIGVLLGTGRYLFYNLVLFLQPALTGIVFLGLWEAGMLTTSTALAGTAVVSLSVPAVAFFKTLAGGVTRPDWSAARSSVWYGLRAHGTNLGGMMNSRLDLLIIPAFLAASNVGLYSVATNVSWIVVSISGAIAAIVLPAAARDPERGAVTVVRSLQATFAVGGFLAICIGATADVGIRLLYGSEFARSDLVLRLLLPGAVFYACAGVLWSGLYALNRPLTAAASQGLGVVVTVVGLLVFLEQGQIVAAALVSTASYLSVFVSALMLYRRAAGLAWRDFFALPRIVDLPVPAWVRASRS